MCEANSIMAMLIYSQWFLPKNKPKNCRRFLLMIQIIADFLQEIGV
jgi:hypothetical protein